MGQYSASFFFLTILFSLVIGFSAEILFYFLAGETGFLYFVAPLSILAMIASAFLTFRFLNKRYVAASPSEIPGSVAGINIAVLAIYLVFQVAFSPESFFTLQTGIDVLSSISETILVYVLLQKWITRDTSSNLPSVEGV